MSEYQQPVAHDIQGYRAEDEIHRRACVGQSVAGLRERVEERHRYQRREQCQEIRPRHRQNLVRLSEAVEEEIEHTHHQCENRRHQRVDLKARARNASCLGMFTRREQCPYQRGDSRGETRQHHQRNQKDTVDESRRRELLDAVGAHHHCVGEAHDYHAELSEQHGKTKTHQLDILVAVASPESFLSRLHVHIPV